MYEEVEASMDMTIRIMGDKEFKKEAELRARYKQNATRERIIERVYVRREILYVPVIQEPADYEVREVLRAHSRRIEELERALHSFNAPRVQVRGGDPPCVVCGAWSDDWLCPSCRHRFPWMRP